MNALETLTVQELIDRLSKYPKDAKVVYAYCYGDRTRTMVASPIGDMDWGNARYSSYIQEHRIVEEGDDPEEDDEKILILS